MSNNRFKTGGIEREMKQVKETCLLALEIRWTLQRQRGKETQRACGKGVVHTAQRLGTRFSPSP